MNWQEMWPEVWQMASCCGLNCPPSPDIGPHNPAPQNVTVFGRRAFKDILKLQ